MKEDLEKSNEKTELGGKRQDRIFPGIKNGIGKSKKMTDQLAVTTESLKKVLSNNQLRVNWRTSSEDLLR
jgi:hypothetical protein